jgi:hypothetical protein
MFFLKKKKYEKHFIKEKPQQRQTGKAIEHMAVGFGRKPRRRPLIIIVTTNSQ